MHSALRPIQYKLAAFDLDGTLIDSHKKLPEQNRKAVLQLIDCGVTIVIASGRPTYGIRPIAEMLQMNQTSGYILSYNGARIIDCSTGQTLSQAHFPRHLLPQLAAATKVLGGVLVTFDDANSTILAEQTNEWVLHEAWLNNQMPLRLVPDLCAAAPEHLPKCLVTAHPDVAGNIATALQQRFPQLEICRSAPFFIEIMPRGIDKATKLCELCNHLDIKAEQVVAFGDSYNDIDMLRWAGCGVAMQNAFAEVKQAADIIAPSNDECGVASFIMQNTKHLTAN